MNSLFYDDYHYHTLQFEYQIIVLTIPGGNNYVMQKIILIEKYVIVK